MSSRIGDLLRKERECRRLTPQRLAEMIGYRSLNKGARKILAVEQHGGWEGGVRTKMIVALGLGDVAAEAIAADRKQRLEAFQRWVREPVPPQMIVRWIPGFYMPQAIPVELHSSQADMERFACEFAAEKRRMVCLKLSRRHSVWISEDGEVYARTEATPDGPVNAPVMSIGGRRVIGLFRPAGGEPRPLPDERHEDSGNVNGGEHDI